MKAMADPQMGRPPFRGGAPTAAQKGRLQAGLLMQTDLQPIAHVKALE